MARQRDERRDPARRKPGAEETPTARQRTIAVTREEAASLLHRAQITAHELMLSGSNYTFVVQMSAEGRGEFLAIYKPQQGERPLWDFPHGTLHRREHAAYVASNHLGWPNIPATVIRDGPFGLGSVQLYVPSKGFRGDLSAFVRHYRSELAEVALFDLLVNNADRKAGHCLPGADGRIWAIDHGLTFNLEPKLRTVLWEYCGESIPDQLLQGLEQLRDDPDRRQALRAELEGDLNSEEVNIFFTRLEKLLRKRKFPRLDPNRNIPWPLV